MNTRLRYAADVPSLTGKTISLASSTAIGALAPKKNDPTIRPVPVTHIDGGAP